MRIRGRKIDFRVSIMPAIHGENVVIRILDKEQINESFSELNLDVVGFAPQDLRKFRKFIAEPYGMVLVTGPTGSGKTTTLYAALNEIKNEEDKIITIEDPVEYQLQGITQIPVNEKKGLTFARGLRSILRHDPDKIMVGEIRDSETAQIAIQSAPRSPRLHDVPQQLHRRDRRFLNMGSSHTTLSRRQAFCPSPRARFMLALQAARPAGRSRAERIGVEPRQVSQRDFLCVGRVRGLQFHRLSRSNGYTRAA